MKPFPRALPLLRIRLSTGVPQTDSESAEYLRRGTWAFWQAMLALFLAGFVTFAVLYCTQPILPMLSSELGLSPATASLSLSVTMVTLAMSLVVAGSLSEAWGRKNVMLASLVASAACELVAAASPSFTVLLVVRAIQGIALAGLPAVAMAYIGEEIHPDAFGLAMGLYISGNSLGGLAGRIVVGALAEAFSWRVGLAAIGVLGLLSAAAFWQLLPASTHFRASPLRLGPLCASLRHHTQDRGMLLLFASGALLMGSFVTLFNYIGYRLVEPPYSLSAAHIGWLFSVYLVGTFSSSWMGRLADRYGRRTVMPVAVALMALGIGLTLAASLPIIVLGMALLTFGFFGGHSIASGWVGKRAFTAKAQASALYLLCYYIGASVVGSVGGLVYGAAGWSGIVVLIGSLLTIALLAALRLAHTPPLAVNQPAWSGQAVRGSQAA